MPIAMLTPVRCFTCGSSTGHVAVVFATERRRRAKEALAARNTAPSMAMVDAGLDLACGDLLDRLQIPRDCCRKTLLTAMIYQDHY